MTDKQDGTNYINGYVSGRQHNDDDPLCLENSNKVKQTLSRNRDCVEDHVYWYWLGYNDGMLDRGIHE